MTRRNGYTLIEMLSVTAAASAVMGVVVGVLALGYRSDRAAREHFHTAQSLDRLSEQFRRDCHQAHQGEVLPEGRGWRLTLPEETSVEYRLGPDGLDRTEHVGGAVRHRETFALVPGTTAAVTFDRDEDPAMARLMLTPPDDAEARRPARPARIMAAVGLDHRFTPATASPQTGDDADEAGGVKR